MTDATTVIISMEDRLKLAELTGELAKLEANIWLYVLLGAVLGLLIGFLLGITLYILLNDACYLPEHKVLRMMPILSVALCVVIGAVAAMYSHSAEMNSIEAQIEMIKQIWGLT